MGFIKAKAYAPEVSPVGKALWPFLTVPNKKWKPEYGEYSVKLLLKPSKSVSAFIKKLEDIRDEHYDLVEPKMDKVAVKKKPLKRMPVYSDNYDSEGEETGLIEIMFQTMAAGKKKDGTPWTTDMKLYDSQANRIKGKINVGNDSVLQVNYTPTGYKMTGDETTKVGCKCYLNAAMIHKLVKYAGTDPGFEASKDEGGYRYTAADAEGDPDFTPGGEEDNEEQNF